MTTTPLQATKAHFLPTLVAAVLGLGVIVVAGHLQTGALHNAAHDMRHAAGFPCH